MLNNVGYLFFWGLFFFSCALEKKEFDNPVDFQANNDQGVKAPTVVFYPLIQTKTLLDSIFIESFLVFKEDSIESFSGIHLQINMPSNLLKLDTITPGIFITDTNQTIPLFNYSYDGVNKIDIYAYFLDTLKYNIEGTGQIAKLVFISEAIGIDSIYYNLEECELINFNDSIININGKRSAKIIIE